MKKTIPLLVFLFLAMAVIYGRPIIVGDGVSYYALAVSLLQDHDFDLTNQRRQIHDVMTPFNPTTGKPASLYSCGFGLMYAPFLAMSHAVAHAIPPLMQWQPYHQNERFPFSDALGIFNGTLLLSLANLLLLYLFLVHNLQQSAWKALAIVMLVFIGTPLAFYTFAMPAYSHAADAFLTTVIFILVFLNLDPSSGRDRIRNIALGLSIALSVSLRNNNGVLALPALATMLFLPGNQSWKRRALIAFEILLGALPILIVQLKFNLSQYGAIVATGYKLQFQKSFLLEILFHPWAGLFLWGPVTALALIGLIMGARKHEFRSIVALITVLLVLVSVSFQGNWWGGCSFGPRFVTHLYFFWVIGLCEFVLRAKRVGMLLSGILALWTFFLFNIFYVNAASVEVKKFLDQENCRRTPVQMIAWAEQDFQKSRFRNPFSFWMESASQDPYPTLQFLIRQRERGENRDSF